MSRLLAIGLLVFINVLWGSTYAVVKVALEDLPPTVLGALRFIVAAGVLWLVLGAFVAGQRGPGRLLAVERVTARDRWRMVALGVLGNGIALVIEYVGIDLTTATDASLMIIGEVTFTAVLAALLTREPLGRVKLWGIAAGTAGVLVLVLGHVEGGGSHGLARAAGDLLILLSLLCQSLYTVFGTDLARRHHPLTVVTWTYTGSLALWLPLLAWKVHAGALATPPGAAAVFGVLYLALVASVLCFLVWFGISRHVGAGVSAMSLFVQPLVGAFIGIVFLGEPVTASLVAGAGLVFVALYLTTRAAGG